MADDTLSRDPLKREVASKPAAPESVARTFIHLRVHSAYSLLEGALQLGKIIGHAVKDEAPAIAVTDTNNLFGALEFARKRSRMAYSRSSAANSRSPFQAKATTRSATAGDRAPRCGLWC